jgi:hypothetical protein
MEEWFRGYGVDGFLFHPSHLPSGLDDFVALVIPELQSRGLFRAEYEVTTLRENMGLERPRSRSAECRPPPCGSALLPAEAQRWSLSRSSMAMSAACNRRLDSRARATRIFVDGLFCGLKPNA